MQDLVILPAHGASQVLKQRYEQLPLWILEFIGYWLTARQGEIVFVGPTFSAALIVDLLDNCYGGA